MSVTNYTLEKCKYNHSKLKNVLYLVSEEHVKDVHVDNGEAYISGLTELPLRINGFNIQYSEETSLDERYKFQKKLTLLMKGYVNYKLFGGRYYAIIEDNDGIYYMINVDFPSKITHTFNLSQNINQTDFTFSSLSNFPTIKLNAEFEAENLPCIGYNVNGIDKLNLINKDYARLDIANKKVKLTGNWSNIEFLGKSCAFQEVYDGENVTDTITFDIPLNHKIGWTWNLLEFLDNLYAATIIPNGGNDIYYSGFNFGLQPSYTIQTSSNNGESDIITVTLVEMSNYGATAAEDFEKEEHETTSWRYIKWLGDIQCYECVGYSTARYLVQQEIDAFGNPTGNYKVKDGYQSQFQMLNVTGTFNNDEQFNEVSCGGDNCKINTTIPDVIVFSSATCNTYTVSASCDWNITGLASYLTASPNSGNADQTYNVSVCNTSSQISGQTSTFTLQAGNNVKIINVELLKDSFINPVVTSITCVSQDVVFAFNPSCPITVASIDSRLTYEIGNSTLTVNVPSNLLTTSEKVWTIEVRDCDNRTVFVKIIQDKVYEEWKDSGLYTCVGGNSYKQEVRYTGETPTNLHITTETRPGELIEEGDSRCNKRMTKWEWVGNYYCVNGNKQKCIEQFESYDNGITWTKTGLTQLGEIVEYDSDWCNIVTEYDWRLTEKWQCGDGTEYTFEYCDGRKFLMEDVPNSGGTYNYCITSIAGSEDVSFNVTRKCDWVTVTPGASSMTVTVEANTDPTSDRECVIYIHQQISGKQVTLNVLQAAGSATCERLLDSCCGASQASGEHPDCDIELGRSGGTESDSVLQDARVRLVSTNLPSWLEVENHDTYVTYRAVEDNTSTSNRYFTVTWEKVSGASTQCDTAETIVKQLGGAVPRPYVFRWENGLPYIEVNVDAEAGVIDKNVISTYGEIATSFTATDSCDWVGSYSATPTNFKIEYDANTGDTSRTCTVYLEQDGSHADMSMAINQSASGASGETYIKWGDELHPSVYSATTTWNGTLTLVPFYSLLNGVETNAVLSTDTNWIITYNQLYYNYNEVKPNRNETIYLNPNTSASDRTGLLTLTQKGGTDYIQVYITQGAYVADCSITSFSIPDSVCQGEPLNYEYTVADARCDRTFYFNVFDASGNTFTSTSSPNNGRGSGTFDTSTMVAGTAQMSVVVGSTTVSKQIQVNSCSSQFDLVGDASVSTTWNGVVSSIFFFSKVGNENVNAVMSSNVSWIKTSGSYYINQNELKPNINNTVYLDNNPSANPRTGTLTLTQKGTDKKLYITITQGAYVPDCKITSFAFSPGDVCKGSETVNFSFTVADTACTTQQNFNLFDSAGNMFNVKVTPSGGSGSGSFNTTNMAIGTASISVVVNGVTTTYQIDIVSCEPTTGFDSLLAQFNTVLSDRNKTQISSSTTLNVYNYLLSGYNRALEEYNGNSELFNESFYDEIYNYHGNNTEYNDTAKDAMLSWLMAMQLSELYADSGVTTNTQTELFLKAYNIGGGRSVPVYNSNDMHSDVFIARYVASAIYAIERSNYTFEQMDSLFRSELNTTPIDRLDSSWTDSKQVTDATCDGRISDNFNIGYALNLTGIFPAAAGPYADNYYNGDLICRNIPERNPDGSQPSNQFNPTTKNYLVDETIDNIVTSQYNLSASDTNISRTVQAVADDEDDIQQMLGGITYYKYNASSPKTTFEVGTSSDNMGSFKGTFNVQVLGKDLSSLIHNTDGTETYLSYFFGGVAYIGGHSRKTLGDPQYGRRRPGQGLGDALYNGDTVVLTSTPRCLCDSGCNTNLNYLIDTSIQRLVGGGTKLSSNYYYYVDNNGDGEYDSGEPTYGDGIRGTTNECAGLHATTYPSGHSSEIWTVALFLMQMLPSRYKEIYKAAYDYTVSRTIVRAHWNSDTMYGKLVGTTIVPVINAFRNAHNGQNVRTFYNAAKSIVDNAPSGGDAITVGFAVHNNTSNSITILNKLGYVLYNDNHYGWDGCYNRYNLIDSAELITIPSNGSYTFVATVAESESWTTTRHFLDVDNCQLFKEQYPSNTNVFLYDANGDSSTIIPQGISPSTLFVDGQIYQVYIN